MLEEVLTDIVSYNEHTLWLLGAVHVLLTGIGYLFVRQRGDKIQAATEALVVFLMPVMGFIMVCGSRLLQIVLDKRSRIDPHKLMMNNNVFTNIISYDENLISLHDTYLVDDVKVKRKVFLDAVKQNVLENPKILRNATRDSDREISYYAVSMVSGHIEALESSMAELEGKLRESPENLKLVKKYADVLREYIGQDFVDKLTKAEKGRVYVEQLDKLLTAEPDNIEYLQEKIRQEIVLEDYQGAEATCGTFQQLYPDREEPYLDFMRLYMETRQPEKLQGKLAELKRSKAELSVEALEKMRYWGGTARGQQ